MLFPFVNLIHGLVLSLIALRLVQLLNLFPLFLLAVAATDLACSSWGMLSDM